MSEKLQKVLARAGLGSRRQIEQWISAGRVSVDGATASLGDRAQAGQCIRVDGHIVTKTQRSGRCRILIYHKPEGELCTRADPKGRPTVFDRLPRLRNGRWISVGRLDFNTAGLLLLTNDGELVNRLTHPRNEIEREYAVRVLGKVNARMIKNLKAGIRLKDGLARFESIRDAGGEGANHWYHVIVKEGRYREVRRLWEKVGAKVSRLIRIRYGPLTLPRGLRAGRWQELEAKDIGALFTVVDLPTPSVRKAGSGRRRNNNSRAARKPRTSAAAGRQRSRRPSRVA